MRRFTNKPVEIRDLQEFLSKPGLSYLAGYAGSGREYTSRIEIHLNHDLNERMCEAVYVHEMLHILMYHQGFPTVGLPAKAIQFLMPEEVQRLQKLRDVFASDLDHLSIYKRMISDYSLDFEEYFGWQVQAKTRRFGKFAYNVQAKDSAYYFIIQQDILDSVNYFAFPEPFQRQILAMFEQLCPDGYRSCVSLYEKLEKIGSGTPALVYKSANLIREHIIKYGWRRQVTANSLWRTLQVVPDGSKIPLDEG